MKANVISIDKVITIITTTTITTTYHPVNVEAEDGGNEKDKPQQWTEEEGGPEDGRIATSGSIRLGAALLLLRLTEEHKLGIGLGRSAWTGSSAGTGGPGCGHGRPILEHPVTLALVVDVVPPAEADQQAAGDVLHHPKVGGNEEDEGDEEAEKLAAEGAAEQVDDHGADLEDEVEEDGHRVSECFFEHKKEVTISFIIV